MSVAVVLVAAVADGGRGATDGWRGDMTTGGGSDVEFADPAQPGAQRLELVEQIERERDAGEIDAEVLRQALGRAHAADADSLEAPLCARPGRRLRRLAAGRRYERLDDTVLDELEHTLGRHLAGAAELGEAELELLVENLADRQIGSVVTRHGQTPSFARGLKFTACSKAS